MWKRKPILNSVSENVLKTVIVICLIIRENLIQIYNY